MSTRIRTKTPAKRTAAPISSGFLGSRRGGEPAAALAGLPRDGPSGEAPDDGEPAERGRKRRRESSVEERDEQDEPQVHHAGGAQDAARVEARPRLRRVSGLPGQDDRGHRRGVRAPEDGGQDDAAASLEDPLQDVAREGDPAHRHDDEERLERVDVEARELPVGDDRQDDDGEDEEFRDGDDLVRGGEPRETLEAFLQLEEEHAHDADRRREPVALLLDEAADRVRRERRDLGREACRRTLVELVEVGEEHQATDDGEPGHPRHERSRRHQGERVAHEPDERKRPDAPEPITRSTLLLLLALEADEERERENERDVEGVGGHDPQQVSEHPGARSRRGRAGPGHGRERRSEGGRAPEAN